MVNVGQHHRGVGLMVMESARCGRGRHGATVQRVVLADVSVRVDGPLILGVPGEDYCAELHGPRTFRCAVKLSHSNKFR